MRQIIGLLLIASGMLVMVWPLVQYRTQRATWANTYTSSTNYDVTPDTGTYMYDDNGHPRYVIKGKDVSREEFERAFPGSIKVTR